MKKFIKSLFYFVIAGLLFTACSDDDDIPVVSNPDNVNGFYFINYGGSSVGPTTITRYDYKNDSVTNDYYVAQNGTELTANVQYACEYEDYIYMMGNDADQIIVVDTAFKAYDIITDSVNTPRFCVANGDYLYVSCLGANPDWSLMEDSYIAVYDITSNSFEQKIALPGGPEGLAIANGNLYAALNYKDSVAVIDLDDYSTSYIITPAVTSYFVKDASNNLYVSLVSTWSDYSATQGLGYINTSSNTLDDTYALDGISSNYAAIMSANNDLSTIYVLATSYDANWNLVGAVYTFDVSSGEFTALVEDLSGTNGLAFNNETDELYVFGGESYSEPGTVDIYSTSGTKTGEFDCGVSPYWTIHLNYE